MYLKNKKELRFLATPSLKAGGQGWIRTNVHLREQIYSLSFIGVLTIAPDRK